jgi:hypothetical protein
MRDAETPIGGDAPAASECWRPRNKPSGNGRVYVRLNGIRWLAHKLQYVKHYKRAIPRGMCVYHKCRNVWCINPEHLELVSKKTAMLRGDNAASRNSVKTHCRQGHPFEGRNLKIRADGSRHCRACGRKWAKEGYRRKKARSEK